jgi:tetratricopeptide (TPR) repeat protein
MWLKAESVWPLFELGRWDEALDAAGEALEWDRTHGSSYIGLLALPYVAHLKLRRGEAEEAASLRDDFLPRARENGDPQVLVPSLATSALIDCSYGDLGGAVAAIEELGEATRERPDWRAQHLPDALRVCAAAGATALAESLLEDIEVSTARDIHAVHAARAVLAESQGRLEEAVALYSEAAEHWAEYGFVLEQGQALLGTARSLAALGRGRDAPLKLEEARQLFARLQVWDLVKEAEALAEQATAFRS